MPFNTKQALEATRPLEIEFGGQTLKGEILASRFTPEALAAAARQASANAREQERKRRPLVAAVEAAQEAYLQAEADKASAKLGADDKNKATDADLSEKIALAVQALDAAEDALSAFEEEGLKEQIVFLSGEVADALASWDAEYEDGTPVPLEKEAIAGCMPWQLIRQIYENIQEAITPPKKPSTDSSDG